MNSLIHYDKYSFNTLEIKTSDGTSIYVPREWLGSLSPYFKSLLSNGCKESYSNSCYLNYESKIISIILKVIHGSYRGEKYIYNYFSKLCTMQESYNFVSALAEYQLDDILHAYDMYLSKQKLEQNMSYILFDIICTFKLENTRGKILTFLKDKIYFLKFIDYNKINFEFTELFFDLGPRIHLKIFTLWASTHRPTDEQLIGSRLLNHKSYNIGKLRKIMMGLSSGLENARNFKCSLYERILYSILESPPQTIYSNKIQQKENTKYKNYIEHEMIIQKINDPNIDNFELMVKIIEKWNKDTYEVDEDDDEMMEDEEDVDVGVDVDV